MSPLLAAVSVLPGRVVAVQAAQGPVKVDFLLAKGRQFSDIAATLGFAEPSAFHRAFRKWTGMRPADYRAVNAHAAGAQTAANTGISRRAEHAESD